MKFCAKTLSSPDTCTADSATMLRAAFRIARQLTGKRRFAILAGVSHVKSQSTAPLIEQHTVTGRSVSISEITLLCFSGTVFQQPSEEVWRSQFTVCHARGNAKVTLKLSARCFVIFCDYVLLFLIVQNVRWSWSELERRADAFAVGLSQKLGLKPGDRLGVW